MIGAIILWSGIVANIPAGWQLCDGTNGTPDLRGKFIRGAFEGTEHTTGGTPSHSHPFTSDAHTHGVALAPTFTLETGVPNARIESSNTVGTTDNADHYPPHYKLAYIQRMS